MAWLDIKGTVVADTVYCENKLVAKDVSFTLPQVSFMTSDVQAMGTMSVPTIGLIEDLELSISKIGLDQGLQSMSKLVKQNLEFRWAQEVIKGDGSIKTEGCKAFVRCIPKSLPGIGIEVGSTSENEMTYAVSRIQIFIGGVEYMLVDRLSQILKINGTDYFSEISSLL